MKSSQSSLSMATPSFTSAIASSAFPAALATKAECLSVQLSSPDSPSNTVLGHKLLHVASSTVVI